MQKQNLIHSFAVAQIRVISDTLIVQLLNLNNNTYFLHIINKYLGIELFLYLQFF